MSSSHNNEGYFSNSKNYLSPKDTLSESTTLYNNKRSTSTAKGNKDIFRSLILQSNPCRVCTVIPDRLNLAKILNQGLYHKYTSSQDYFYTKDINNIISKKHKAVYIKYLDYMIYDESVEHFKRCYKKKDAMPIMKEIQEFYTKFKDYPRNFNMPFYRIIGNCIRRHRRLEYRMVFRTFESEDNPEILEEQYKKPNSKQKVSFHLFDELGSSFLRTENYINPNIETSRQLTSDNNEDPFGNRKNEKPKFKLNFNNHRRLSDCMNIFEDSFSIDAKINFRILKEIGEYEKDVPQTPKLSESVLNNYYRNLYSRLDSDAAFDDINNLITEIDRIKITNHSYNYLAMINKYIDTKKTVSCSMNKLVNNQLHMKSPNPHIPIRSNLPSTKNIIKGTPKNKEINFELNEQLQLIKNIKPIDQNDTKRILDSRLIHEIKDQKDSKESRERKDNTRSHEKKEQDCKETSNSKKKLLVNIPTLINSKIHPNSKLSSGQITSKISNRNSNSPIIINLTKKAPLSSFRTLKQKVEQVIVDKKTTKQIVKNTKPKTTLKLPIRPKMQRVSHYDNTERGWNSSASQGSHSHNKNSSNTSRHLSKDSLVYCGVGGHSQESSSEKRSLSRGLLDMHYSTQNPSRLLVKSSVSGNLIANRIKTHSQDIKDTIKEDLKEIEIKNSICDSKIELRINNYMVGDCNIKGLSSKKVVQPLKHLLIDNTKKVAPKYLINKNKSHQSRYVSTNNNISNQENRSGSAKTESLIKNFSNRDIFLPPGNTANITNNTYSPPNLMTRLGSINQNNVKMPSSMLSKTNILRNSVTKKLLAKRDEDSMKILGHEPNTLRTPAKLKKSVDHDSIKYFKGLDSKVAFDVNSAMEYSTFKYPLSGQDKKKIFQLSLYSNIGPRNISFSPDSKFH